MYENFYPQIVDALVEDGYVVIDDVFNTKVVDGLSKYIQNSSNSFKEAGISSSNYIDKQKRRDKIQWLDDKDEFSREFLSFSSSLKNYLNRSLYLGLSYYEAHFAIYNNGDFYEKHLDSFKNSKNRVVTTVFYLNSCDGGELLIYNENDKVIKVVKPQKNRLIVFLSEKFPHEVLPAKTKRYSIAGWFRVDKF